MADTVIAAAHEQHADIGHAVEHHGVMTGTARKPSHRHAAARDGVGQRRL